MQELKTKIIAEIEEKNLKPKPKWLFAFKAVGLGLSVLFVFLFALYLLIFVGFVISERDWVQESTYSLSGVYFLLNTLPFSMILLATVMIFIASVTAYRYGLSYKKPFIYIFVSIIVILLLARLVFVESGLQNYIKEEAFRQNVQLVPTSWKDLRNTVKNAKMK